MHWSKMLVGKSYYHAPQGLGKAFHTNALKGYFNDLTGKTKWKGLLDSEGIPICQLIDGSIKYFPTTIIQKALGHCDLFIISKDNDEFEQFIKICNWLIKSQDERGGWVIKDKEKFEQAPRYSAMVQGEAISALVRAWKYTDNAHYIEAATKAYELLIAPQEKGGTAHYKDKELYIEEIPSAGEKVILNGWIFALFGIYDYFLAASRPAERIFNQSFKTLQSNIHKFDSGYWSFYDWTGTLASPFYHNLHISQLEALFILTGEESIKHYIEKWKNYKKSFCKSKYAFILKAHQKLKNPSPVVIIK
jgi:heparosan-N-sulfate-glucuronate 5-epimerase